MLKALEDAWEKSGVEFEADCIELSMDSEFLKWGMIAKGKLLLPKMLKPRINSLERMWATPNALNSNEGEHLGSWLARRERLKESQKNGNGAGMPLSVMVKAFEQAPTTKEKTNLTEGMIVYDRSGSRL